MQLQLRDRSGKCGIIFTIGAFATLSLAFAGSTFLSRADAQEMIDLSSDIAAVIPGPAQSIAFTSTRDSVNNVTNNEAYVMNPDGDPATQNRRTNALSNDQRPDISPDGSQIVFASNRNVSHFEIWIMNSDGTNPRPLTSFGSSTVNNNWPRWSPDGQWIAFHSGGGNSFQIFRMRPDGTDLTPVTSGGFDQFPNWSPDGTRLAIRRGTELYTIDSSDGSNPVRLTFTDTVPGAFNQMASFSHDGTQIAFLSNNRDTPTGPVYLSVYVMDTDGSNKVNHTPKPDGYAGAWTSRAPDWSPNGKFIYFTGVRSLLDSGTREEIFVRPVDCFDEACETRLTSDKVNSEASVRKVHAPIINGVTATPDVLWPPNNEMIPVSLTVDVTDNSDPSPVCQITDVNSNEPVTEDAWKITGPLDLDLIAQRYGMRSGRIYNISVTCTNTSELDSTATTTVTVPHDEGKHIGLGLLR